MQIIVHFGIHKTASTYFQKEIFSKCPGIIYIPRAKCKNFNNYIISSAEFDTHVAKKLFDEVISSLRIYVSENSQVLISNEDYYGNPFDVNNDTLTILKRFIALFGKQFFPVVFFRNQEMLVRSLFLQFIKTGGYKTFNEFVSPEKGLPILNREYLYFDRFALYLKEHLNPNRFIIFTYEDFEKDKTELLLKFFRFIYREDIKTVPFKISEHIHNISLNPKFINASVFLNRFVKNYRYPDHTLPFFLYRMYMKFFLYFSEKREKPGFDMPMPAALLEEISQSNLVLDKEFKNLQIFKYGYP